jgi:hypothetical protein
MVGSEGIGRGQWTLNERNEGRVRMPGAGMQALSPCA